MKLAEYRQFFNQVSEWPKNQFDRNRVAELILKISDVSLVYLFFESLGPGSEKGVAIRFLGETGIQDITRNEVVNFLDGKWASLDHPSIPAIPVSLKNISLLSLPSSTQFENPKDMPVNCRVVIGSTSQLSEQDELVFTSIYWHLFNLAKVSIAETEVGIRGQFLSIASHELKTPLTSIYGILQLQERMVRMKPDQTSFPEQERHHSFLKMVIRQTERLNELIDGLLDVSRIQNGRFTVEPSETNIASLLKECTQSRLAIIAKESGVKLNVEAPDSFIAKVDPVRIEEVISNLVMNAIRYSPEGGVVWIRLIEEEDSFRLTVRDQGPSIPIESREKIFQPFERAQRTARLGGLGLGLFISRQIAQLHGGNVSLVESISGKGNLFEAYIPTRS